MTRYLFLAILIFFASAGRAADTDAFAAPRTTLEQALVQAKGYVMSRKIDLAGMFLAKAEWSLRADAPAYWHIEWRTPGPVKGGFFIVMVHPDGKIEHALGE